MLSIEEDTLQSPHNPQAGDALAITHNVDIVPELIVGKSITQMNALVFQFVKVCELHEMKEFFICGAEKVYDPHAVGSDADFIRDCHEAGLLPRGL